MVLLLLHPTNPHPQTREEPRGNKSDGGRHLPGSSAAGSCWGSWGCELARGTAEEGPRSGPGCLSCCDTTSPEATVIRFRPGNDVPTFCDRSLQQPVHFTLGLAHVWVWKHTRNKHFLKHDLTLIKSSVFWYFLFYSISFNCEKKERHLFPSLLTRSWQATLKDKNIHLSPAIVPFPWLVFPVPSTGHSGYCKCLFPSTKIFQGWGETRELYTPIQYVLLPPT